MRRTACSASPSSELERMSNTSNEAGSNSDDIDGCSTGLDTTSSTSGQRHAGGPDHAERASSYDHQETHGAPPPHPAWLQADDDVADIVPCRPVWIRSPAAASAVPESARFRLSCTSSPESATRAAGLAIDERAGVTGHAIRSIGAGDEQQQVLVAR